MAIDGRAVASRSRPATASLGAGAGRRGSMRSSMRRRRPAPYIPILLHDGKEARTVGKLTVSSEPPIRHDPASHRPRRCPPTAFPSGWMLKNATGSICPSADRRATG